MMEKIISYGTLQNNKNHYSKTMKGRMVGILQIGIFPTILLGIGLYVAFDSFTADNIGIIVIVMTIFFMTFGLFGYEMGPVYIPQRTLKKLSRKYFNY